MLPSVQACPQYQVSITISTKKRHPIRCTGFQARSLTCKRMFTASRKMDCVVRRDRKPAGYEAERSVLDECHAWRYRDEVFQTEPEINLIYIYFTSALSALIYLNIPSLVAMSRRPGRDFERLRKGEVRCRSPLSKGFWAHSSRMVTAK